MNRILYRSFLFFAILLTAGHLLAQTATKQTDPSVKTLTPDEKASYQKQATQLVGFMEYAFNTLGSKKTDYKDKDVIINQSYLKFFKDAKVQVEDDLVQKRDVVTNKDVQAYLKDIDFFFREVSFKFTIEEITQEESEKGELYFKVKTSRNLKGISLDGKEVNNNLPRFIEINLDDATRDLKIVSIYTTKSSEEQELISWWNSLDSAWRNFFAGDILADNDLLFRDVRFIGSDFIVRPAMQVSDSIQEMDTIKMNPSRILGEVRKIWRTERIDIKGMKNITQLEPIAALTLLKSIDISSSSVTDLRPIRNLSKLEMLVAAETPVSSLEPLQYSSSIQHLDISGSQITDLSPLANFTSLTYLNLSDLQILDLEPLRNLVNLRELYLKRVPVSTVDALGKLISLEILDLAEMSVSDITPLAGLSKLIRISLEQTQVTDIGPMSTMNSLQYVFIDSTFIGQLSPLEKLADLKVVYCDKSQISKSIALKFMQARPDVKVIYESEELSVWWEAMPETWKSIFRQLVTLDQPPQREQLHEVSFLKKIDIAGWKDIQSLDPLRKLTSLTHINASRTGISDVKVLQELLDMEELNISSTKVSDLGPLSGLTGIRQLNISETAANDLTPLSGLRNLRVLNMDSVAATNPEILAKLKHLELVYADGVDAMAPVIAPLWDSIPGALIIFQTPAIISWWNGLNDNWRMILREIETIDPTPKREQLQRVASLRALDLSQSREISGLQPIRMLKQLEVLNISGTTIGDLSPLLTLNNLKEFNCSNTPVEDISSITSHRNLKIFNCSNTQINDIDPLEQLNFIEKVDISGTQVSRLNALGKSYTLIELSCFNTRVSNLKPLEDLDHLKVLKIYNTRVSGRKVDSFKQERPGVEVIFY